MTARASPEISTRFGDSQLTPLKPQQSQTTGAKANARPHAAQDTARGSARFDAPQPHPSQAQGHLDSGLLPQGARPDARLLSGAPRRLSWETGSAGVRPPPATAPWASQLGMALRTRDLARASAAAVKVPRPPHGTSRGGRSTYSEDARRRRGTCGRPISEAHRDTTSDLSRRMSASPFTYPETPGCSAVSTVLASVPPGPCRARCPRSQAHSPIQQLLATLL
ncbi:uncharacterized protein LOC120598643 [Pteropus medius]|uniref:uncharacterized protein LOC120598643 n=1 Tax=Pteropus vampyrus TaxID=132908 RepID=UPI00196A26D0|nr:uncharacterized protein LOC120598643 [Pteropus giganteus]